MFRAYIHTFIYVYAYTHVYTHTHNEHYSAIKKNEILPFTATWIDLEGTVLSEISWTEKDKYWMKSVIYEMQKIQPSSEYSKKEADSQI